MQSGQWSLNSGSKLKQLTAYATIVCMLPMKTGVVMLVWLSEREAFSMRCFQPQWLEAAGASAVAFFGVCTCLIWTHPAQWDGQDGTSWQPGQPGTQTQRHPSARHAGSADDALLNRGRQSLCNEDILQCKHIRSFLVTSKVKMILIKPKARTDTERCHFKALHTVLTSTSKRHNGVIMYNMKATRSCGVQLIFCIQLMHRR